MQTSSFFRFQGEGRISIARKVPRGTPAGYRIYKPLWPGKWLWEEPYKSDIELYRKKYHDDVLSKLNPQQVYDDLHRLAGNVEPVLLCWESLTQQNDWCHRRMTAEWLENQLGIKVPEMAIKTEKKVLQGALFEL